MQIVLQTLYKANSDMQQIGAVSDGGGTVHGLGGYWCGPVERRRGLVASGSTRGRAVRRQGLGHRSRLGWLYAALWVLGLGFVFESTVLADDSSAPSAVERAAARKLMAEGFRFEKAGEYAKAANRYRSAHNVMHVPSTGLALAKALALEGKLLEANAIALESANLPHVKGESDVMESAREGAKSLVAELQDRIANVSFQVRPDGASYALVVDGKPVSQALQTQALPVDPGVHHFQVRAPGYYTFTKAFGAAEGENVEVAVDLVPDPAGVKVDNAVASGEVASEDSGQRSHTLGYASLGVGSALLVVGVVSGLMVLSDASDLRDRCGGDTCPATADQDLRDDIDSAETLGWVSTVTLPLGLLGVGYGLYDLLFAGEHGPENGAQQVGAMGLRRAVRNRPISAQVGANGGAVKLALHF